MMKSVVMLDIGKFDNTFFQNIESSTVQICAGLKKGMMRSYFAYLY